MDVIVELIDNHGNPGPPAILVAEAQCFARAMEVKSIRAHFTSTTFPPTHPTCGDSVGVRGANEVLSEESGLLAL